MKRVKAAKDNFMLGEVDDVMQVGWECFSQLAGRCETVDGQSGRPPTVHVDEAADADS